MTHSSQLPPPTVAKALRLSLTRFSVEAYLLAKESLSLLLAPRAAYQLPNAFHTGLKRSF